MCSTRKITECGICEHQKICLLNDICSQCYWSCFENKTNIDIDLFALLLSIDQEKRIETNTLTITELSMLQRRVYKLLGNIVSFDPRIETKCPKCKISISKITSYENKPHDLYCRKCKYYFCSNCKLDGHNLHLKLTCAKYSQLVKFNDSEGVNKLKKSIYKFKGQYFQTQNTQIKQFLSAEIVKYCPYSTWEDAKNYEMLNYGYLYNSNDSGALTKKYTKKDWHKVGCPSNGLPVTKTNCDHIICGRHTIAEYMDRTSTRGCKRSISWRYWVPFVPNFDSLKNIKPSTIIKRMLTNTFNQVFCCKCRKNRTTFALMCTNHTCKYKHKWICAKCILTKNKSTYGNKTLTFVNESTGVISTFNQKEDGIASGKFKMNDMILENNGIYDKARQRNYNISGISLNNISSGVYRNITIRHVGYFALSVRYNLIVEETKKNEGYQCLEKNHILKFRGGKNKSRYR